MAICMLIIVPVFLYALFLDDLLRYSLDAQETATSTVWDFAVQDYSKDLPTAGTKSKPFGGLSVVQKHARQMFCDHESGKDRFNDMVTVTNDDGTSGQNYKDCEEQDHHKSLAAHVCWVNDNAKQVTCDTPDRSVGKLGATSLHSSYESTFTHGGLIRCSARAVVENYLLPKKFLPEFSDKKGEVNLTKERWQDSSKVHENAQSGTKTNAYFIKEQRLSILTDTWALTKPADVRPGNKSGELYDRVANVYQNRFNIGYNQMDLGARAFFSQAASGLLNPAFVSLGMTEDSEPLGSDNPHSPNIGIKPHLKSMTTPSEKIDQEGSSRYYFNTEWRDWDQDRNRKTYQARGEFYMGCKTAEGC
jgi:hypothetical protein